MKPIPITFDYYQTWIAELADQLGIPLQDAQHLLDEELAERSILIVDDPRAKDA